MAKAFEWALTFVSFSAIQERFVFSGYFISLDNIKCVQLEINEAKTPTLVPLYSYLNDLLYHGFEI